MTKSSRPKKLKSISHGRPLPVSQRKASLSSKATRNLIRSHHQLHKARAQAIADGNEALVAKLDKAIAANGGLESYQLASKKGQSNERGGDSSRVLVDWLGPVLVQLKKKEGGDGRLRILEVGALSTQNACSKLPNVDVTRIDLNSQESGILQQDFMERPLPATDDGTDTFHIVSLSLVLNYVPDHTVRGEMLRRTTRFFPPKLPDTLPTGPGLLPSLFLVLPAPCVLNSRYFTEERLGDIMSSLGYAMVKRKVTSKLVYYLWHYQGDKPAVRTRFNKEILNQGKTRNNFTVALMPLD